MVDSETLYSTLNHNVRVIDNDNNSHVGKVYNYESEWDSGTGEADIWIDDGIFSESDIQSIDITD